VKGKKYTNWLMSREEEGSRERGNSNRKKIKSMMGLGAGGGGQEDKKKGMVCSKGRTP